MRREEALWIGARLAEFGVDEISPVIELGSATADFRTKSQPHIDAFIHEPLRKRGVAIVHSDFKAGEGVDVSGDIYLRETQERLCSVGARCILCCNIFEHVLDRAAFAAICDQILSPGGVLIVTVPFNYPYHLDPIDTYFRPSPTEIAQLFPDYRIASATVLDCGSYGRELGRMGMRDLSRQLWRHALSLPMFWLGRARWLARNHRLAWLAKPYKISAVVLCRPS